jgi:hypothetical protein
VPIKFILGAIYRIVRDLCQLKISISPKVHYLDVRKVWLVGIDEFEVSRIFRDIIIAVGFTGELDDKTMSETMLSN